MCIFKCVWDIEGERKLEKQKRKLDSSMSRLDERFCVRIKEIMSYRLWSNEIGSVLTVIYLQPSHF
jgi:hypothetical protein